MNGFFNTNSQSVGIEVTSSHLRIATLRRKNKKWEIISLQSIEIDSNNQKDFSLSHGTSISVMPCRDVLVRQCEIPLKKPKDLFSALDFHMEPLLPYATDNAVIQGQINRVKENSTLLTVFSTRKDHLTQHLDTLKAHHIVPEVVTPTAHALAAFSELLPKTASPLLIVYEGEMEIATVLVKNGLVLAARSIDPKGNIDAEIQKTLLNFSSSHPTQVFKHIYFLGTDKKIHAALATSNLNVESPSAPDFTISQEELIQFALPIGAALAQEKINFRQKEFVYPHPFRRIKRPLATFFVLSALLCASLVGLGEKVITAKREAVEHVYVSLLEAENTLSNQLPKKPVDYLSSLNELEKNVHARPNTFPLLPLTPKVKEVLSWLTSLPEIQEKDGPVIEIESFHYQMVKRPDFSHKSMPYKVRVELELAAKNSRAARAFQDALKNDNPFIDSKEEIQWISSKGKYKASFYLKDKTRYS